MAGVDGVPEMAQAPVDAAVGRRRLTVVVNPKAGGGRAAKVLGDVRAALERWADDVTVETTKSLEHADELTRAAVAEGRVTVALGGDGLVGRVAGAVARAGGVLAILPGGRGNDFARGLGIPRDPAVAAAALAAAVERRVDLPEANGVPFVGIASLGFDSDVQVIANRTTRLSGQSVYTYAVLRALLAWKPARFTVSVDGGTPFEHVGWTVGAANGPYYGGGMKFAPAADIADGQLEIVLIAKAGRLTFLRLFPRIFSGRHVEVPYVQVRRAQRLVVQADRPFQVYADGDPVADLPAEIVIRPGALRLLVPPRS
ncbi:diacylglycerol kinase [Frankia sp. R43]|uniref:diacylglycerol/lipid kinase family protein n=1 Tax=Frankia sp. R43 TaxID=269536 RepID=UPI0006CA0C8C|nr:diacylglycerol kinase family protein [Frankia sp. R43]KPM57427.1 diacylglycerol kinase [Frankia sp. R43]